MGGACGTHEQMSNACKMFVGKPEKKTKTDGGIN
jgi:hypothetical protein